MSSSFLFADILIADPDFDFAHTVRMVLQSAGYTVRRVEQGQAVLEAVSKLTPDLILLSVALPDISGYEVTRQIKREGSSSIIPIIMIGEQDHEEDIAAALNAGADEFLRKPVSNAELLLRVRAMLRLKGMTDALAKLNATLEQKVIERTQALEQAHERLRHGEKLSALGRLAASVAHDINNPLTGILNYIYLLKQEYVTNTALVEDLALIERQVNVIADLVRQLQNFSKPPRKNRVPVALPVILDDILALVGKDLEKRNIEVTSTCPTDLPNMLAAPDQISEVFMNLMVNARDAMPEGGKLDINVFSDKGHIVAEISDTGMGMSEEVKAHLFEPFFTTKGEHGTGLGLAICYRIIEEHGGEIDVESQPNEGTTFQIRLPYIKHT